jgi:hypothetical protein
MGYLITLYFFWYNAAHGDRVFVIDYQQIQAIILEQWLNLPWINIWLFCHRPLMGISALLEVNDQIFPAWIFDYSVIGSFLELLIILISFLYEKFRIFCICWAHDALKLLFLEPFGLPLRSTFATIIWGATTNSNMGTEMSNNIGSDCIENSRMLMMFVLMVEIFQVCLTYLLGSQRLANCVHLKP